MSLYRIQTSIQDTSLLPRDQYVNSIHVHMPTMTQGSFDAIVAAAQQFYGSDIAEYWSPAVLNGVGHRVKAYLMGAALDSPPVFETSLLSIPNPPGQIGLPNEVACCVSMHADPQPGVVRQSWRGRIYIGPFNTSVVGPAGTQQRPLGTFVGDLATSAKTYFDAINAITGAKLCVYSRKQAMAYPVTYIGIDDAWDTQRSRGNRPTGIVSRQIAGGGGVGFPPEP
jgi:hypothetical protein